MKKKYNRFALRIILIATFILGIGMAIFLFQKAKSQEARFNDWCLLNISQTLFWPRDLSECYETTDTFLPWYRKSTWDDYTEGFAFYGELYDAEGNLLAVSEDDSSAYEGRYPIINKLHKKIPDLYAGVKNYCNEKFGEWSIYDSVGSVQGYTYNLEAVEKNDYFVYMFFCADIWSFVLRDSIHAFVLVGLIWLLIVALVLHETEHLYEKQAAFDERNRHILYGIAHELKTPLAVIKSSVENWQYIASSEREKYGNNMIYEIDHMSKLISEMLNYYKIEAGERKLQLEEVDLLSLTGSVMKQYETLIEERGLSVQVRTDKTASEYLVNADLELMRLVLSNFLSNAVKYAEKEVVIYITIRRKVITYSVENDGNTLTDAECEKVWDAFYKKDVARTKRIGSSGMGLAVTKNILQCHRSPYGCSIRGKRIKFWFEMKQSGKSYE